MTPALCPSPHVPEVASQGKPAKPCPMCTVGGALVPSMVLGHIKHHLADSDFWPSLGWGHPARPAHTCNCRSYPWTLIPSRSCGKSTLRARRLNTPMFTSTLSVATYTSSIERNCDTCSCTEAHPSQRTPPDNPESGADDQIVVITFSAGRCAVVCVTPVLVAGCGVLVY